MPRSTSLVWRYGTYSTAARVLPCSVPEANLVMLCLLVLHIFVRRRKLYQTIEIEELARQSCQLFRGKEDVRFGLESSEDSFGDGWDTRECCERLNGCIGKSCEASRPGRSTRWTDPRQVLGEGEGGLRPSRTMVQMPPLAKGGINWGEARRWGRVHKMSRCKHESRDNRRGSA
jgi:hypothetical protein